MNYTQIFTSIYGSPSQSQVADYNNDEFLSSRIDQLDKDGELLEAERQIILRKSLQSDNPRLLIKAQSYLDNLIEERSRATGGVSVIMDPDINQYSRGGYLSKRFALTGEYLRKMAQTPAIKGIITTRQTQVSRFSRPQRNKYEYGFKILKKPEYYTDEIKESSEEEKKKIKYLTDFILNGGDLGDNWTSDNFDTFLQKLVDDSLTLDAACFEIGFRRNGAAYSYTAVDSSTIFKADIDEHGNYQARTGEAPKKLRGYYPSHVQVIKDRIVADWYPWEICYGIRNARTDITQNGYGRSELEDMVTIVTALLNTEKYNSNFFTQGSNPKGVLKVPTGVNRNRVAELRQEWMSMVSGVSNAWKIPVLEGDGVEWIDMQMKNSDMEFSKWQEYLVKIACAIYKISPSEIGFTFTNESNGFGDSGKREEARLKYSKDKGLIPLLKSIEFWINKWIIGQIDDRFEFKFVGIDTEDETGELDRDIRSAQTFMGLREVRAKRGLNPELEEGDMIVNPQWIQWQTAQQMAESQQQSQEVIDQEGQDIWNNLDSENMTDLEKAVFTKYQDNPMMIDAITQLTKALQSDE